RNAVQLSQTNVEHPSAGPCLYQLQLKPWQVTGQLAQPWYGEYERQKSDQSVTSVQSREIPCNLWPRKIRGSYPLIALLNSSDRWPYRSICSPKMKLLDSTQ